MPGHRQAALVLVYAGQCWCVLLLSSWRSACSIQARSQFSSHFIIKRHSHPLRPNEFYENILSAPAGHSWPVNPGCLHLLYRKSASLVFAIHICICQNLHVCRLSFAFYCLLFALSACRNFTVNPNCRQFGQDAVRTAPLTRTLHLMILSIQLFVGSGGVCVSDSKEHS